MSTLKAAKAALRGVSLLALVSLGAQEALASGFAVREQSGTALGNAFAGATSGVDDISYSFFNPASLTYHDKNQVSSTLSYIIPRAEFNDGQASTITGIPFVAVPGQEDPDAGDDALVPAFHGMLALDDRFRVGLSVTAPFGLLTEYDDGWIGRYHALDSRLTTILVNPQAAYRVTDWLSIGAGFQALYADARLGTQLDLGSVGAALGVPGSVPTQQDGRATVRGDDFGVGYNVGLMVEPLDRVRVGVAYRSAIDVDLTGNADFDVAGAGTTGQALQAAGLFVDTGASAGTTLPETLSFGVNYDVTDRFSIMGEGAWTRWSRFQDLVIQFDNPLQEDSFTEEDWNNTWFAAIGATYRPTDNWTLRFGLAHDQSPVPDRTRTPRIPDEDRYWIAAGVGYQLANWLDVSLSYTHIFLPDASLDLSATDPGSTFRGNLSGEYNSGIDIIALQGNLRF